MSDVCPNQSFDHDIYKYMYDPECAQTRKIDEGVCGVQLVNDVFSLLAELPVHVQCLNNLSLVFMVMLLQVGGIPVPGNGPSTTMWAVSAALIVLQGLAAFLSFVFAASSFGEFRKAMAPCAVPFNNDLDMIDVVALPTFMFQPSLLTKFLLMYIYFSAYVEVVKVFCGARNLNPKVSVRWLGCCGPVMRWAYCLGPKMEDGTIDDFLQLSFLHRVMFPAFGFCLVLWLASLSFLYALVFFLPICLFMILVEYATVRALALLHSWLGTRKGLSKKAEGLKNLVQAMTWWAPNLVVEYEGSSFVGALAISAFFLVLSPLVVFGTWFAAHAYAGHSPEENMQLVADMYEFTFHCFTSPSLTLLVLPSFDFNLSHLPEALAAVAGALAQGLQGFTAPEYLNLSRFCTLLTLALGILKTVVSWVVAALAAWECVQTPIPFSKIAEVDEPDEWAAAEQEVQDETKEKNKSSGVASFQSHQLNRNGAKVAPNRTTAAALGTDEPSGAVWVITELCESGIIGNSMEIESE